MSKSNYLENKILDHALGTTAFTQPTNQYLALHTADPTDAASGAELSAASEANRTGYARIAVDFNAASSGTATGPDAVKEFTNSHASSSWTQVTHFGIWDASSSGNLLYYGALTTAKTIAAGDTLRFTAGSISISEA